jgi:hypothetical protein
MSWVNWECCIVDKVQQQRDIRYTTEGNKLKILVLVMLSRCLGQFYRIWWGHIPGHNPKQKIGS